MSSKNGEDCLVKIRQLLLLALPRQEARFKACATRGFASSRFGRSVHISLEARQAHTKRCMSHMAISLGRPNEAQGQDRDRLTCVYSSRTTFPYGGRHGRILQPQALYALQTNKRDLALRMQNCCQKVKQRRPRFLRNLKTKVSTLTMRNVVKKARKNKKPSENSST